MQASFCCPRIALMSATPLAFKQAYDVLNAAPSPPSIGASPSQSFRDSIRQIERGFAHDVATWRVELLKLREAVKKSFQGLIELSGDVREPLDQLRDLIQFSGEMLDQREALYKKTSEELTAEADRLAAVSLDDARAFRKSLRRYLDLVAEEYDSRASFYRFLKQLHADYDPDARGGPTFSNAEDLIAYLRD